MTLPSSTRQFLASIHPYDSLSEDALSALSDTCTVMKAPVGEQLFAIGETVEHLYVIQSGEVDVTDESGAQISLLGPRNSFGERALLRGGVANRAAATLTDATLILVPAAALNDLIAAHPSFARFFDRRRPSRDKRRDLATLPISELMTRPPLFCAPDATVREGAEVMRDKRISSLCIVEKGALKGVVTVRDITGRVVAGGADPAAPIATIMTPEPLTLGPSALGTDVLHLMMERGVGHIPIVEAGRLVGIVTQTDLTRAQAMSSAELVGRVSSAATAAEMAKATAEIPKLLAQLVGSGSRHEVVTRLITDIADAATRRLLAMAEDQLGPPPVPYVWVACGSQGRQEQTGVSDQDNCLILSDEATAEHDGYFSALATFVCDGLDACGYFYCPGDMMATNPRWRQPLKVWRGYFDGWIAKPNPEAQMLASVMFDMRPIGGEAALFEALQAETLKNASKNSIFTAHMISNSLKHAPPLGLLRGLATIRSGEHRNRLDLKLNGVVPVVDLGRIYTLRGQLKPANTRARLEAAQEAGVLSATGGADLLDAYDLIAEMRLEHQAAQVKLGEKPDNFLDPAALSDFERSHLRDAFVVVKTMQSSAGTGTGALG